MTAETLGVLLSKPVYGLTEPVAPACQRVLVAQDARVQAVAELVAMLAADAAPLQLLSLYGSCDGAVAQQCCNDPDRLKSALHAVLAAAHAGLRLYVCGDESFIWRIVRQATKAGLQEEEIEALRVGARRQMYCVHCSTLQEISDETETVCCGCRVRLMVREHFSRRLGAYMGVCIDPDQPYAEGAR